MSNYICQYIEKGKCNRMIRVAVCDDDTSTLRELSILLETYRVEHKQEIAYTIFQSPLELLAEVEKGMYWDIIFLETLLPGENGIDTAKEIRQHDTNVKIIFLTSTPEYAVQSYSVKAFSYQLKPLSAESFNQLMDSAILECEKKDASYLILKCKNGISRIELDKLKYCEVMGRTLLFHMEDGSVLERNGCLEELSEQLHSYVNFFRPHRSFLVNMEFVQNISNKKMIMNDYAEIPIPHGKYTEVKERYLEYAVSGYRVNSIQI